MSAFPLFHSCFAHVVPTTNSWLLYPHCLLTGFSTWSLSPFLLLILPSCQATFLKHSFTMSPLLNKFVAHLCFSEQVKLFIETSSYSRNQIQFLKLSFPYFWLISFSHTGSLLSSGSPIALHSFHAALLCYSQTWPQGEPVLSLRQLQSKESSLLRISLSLRKGSCVERPLELYSGCQALKKRRCVQVHGRKIILWQINLNVNSSIEKSNDDYMRRKTLDDDLQQSFQCRYPSDADINS